MSSSGKLALQSKVKLSSGYEMPVLGLGVYQNHSCIPACAAALKYGYRYDYYYSIYLRMHTTSLKDHIN